MKTLAERAHENQARISSEGAERQWIDQAFIDGYLAAIDDAAKVAEKTTNETDGAYAECGLLPVGKRIAARIRSLATP